MIENYNHTPESRMKNISLERVTLGWFIGDVSLISINQAQA